MRKQNVLLTVWLIAPILIVVFLCYWILLSLKTGPAMSESPVGAGGGQTGGANAIGEYLTSRRTSHHLELIVEDRTGLATKDHPLLIAFSANEWVGIPMTQGSAAAWSWTGDATDLADGFEIQWQNAAGAVHRDKDGRRTLRITSGEQREVISALVP